MCGLQEIRARREKRSRRDEGKQWKSHSSQWRDSLDVSGQYRPWTTSGAVLFGVPATDRVKDLLDCIVAQKGRDGDVNLSAQKACQKVKSQDVFVDISQSHLRPTFTDRSGFLPTMTTSSLYYSFRSDSMLAPIEYLMLQGHSHESKLASLSPAEVRTLAGEGMSLPSLGVAIWTWFVLINAKGMVEDS